MKINIIDKNVLNCHNACKSIIKGYFIILPITVASSHGMKLRYNKHLFV